MEGINEVTLSQIHLRCIWMLRVATGRVKGVTSTLCIQ